MHAFATLGVPKSFKTDNGSAYQFYSIKLFLQDWSVDHVFGIPHSPTGQAIVERAHKNLKHMLEKQRRGNMPPQEQLDNATYTLNFLNCSVDHLASTAREQHSVSGTRLTHKPKVWFQDPLDYNQWKGPVELLTWGRGYACVLLPSGPRWLPP